MPGTIEQFGKSLIAAGLMTVDELKGLWGKLPAERRPKDADGFAKLLREQGKISDYQAQVLLQGKAASLTFGNYTLFSQLGVGASGRVYRAKHKTSGREVAIKVLATEVAGDEKSVKRFYREAQATAQLTHPNIVRAFDAGEFNGQHYLVMEYVEGADLSSLVKTGGPMAFEEAVKAVLHAARGFEYAHARGIIHRDVKPGNLLRDKTGTVRILDLGLARFENSDEATGDGLTGTQQVMGTIDYMSPEQVLDTRHADARADQYSLGCTLWYLLTGKKPYEAKGIVERIMLHRTGAIPKLVEHCPTATPQLDAVFRKMVAKKPEDRYASMTDVCAALERVLNGQPEAFDDPTEVFEGSELQAVEAADDVSLTNLPTAASYGSADAGPFAIATATMGVKVAAKATPKPAQAPSSKKLDKRLLYGGIGIGVIALVAFVVWLALR